jgi:hypothetical protein
VAVPDAEETIGYHMPTLKFPFNTPIPFDPIRKIVTFRANDRLTCLLARAML